MRWVRWLLVSVPLAVAGAAVPTGTVAPAAGAPSPAPGLSPPGCSTSVAEAPELGQVPVQFVDAPAPFGVVVSPDGRHVIVGAGGELVVYRLIDGELSRQAALETRSGLEVFGLALSRDGRTLLAVQGSGASVFDATQLESAASSSSARAKGTLTSRGGGAIEAAVAPDGRYGFVSLEDSHELAVFRLAGPKPFTLVGYVPLEIAPVGLAIAPGGRCLYATSELTGRPLSGSSQGTLTTIDVEKAELSPAHSVVSTVDAGCSPVRVVATKTSVYVTARESDEVIRFSASDLVTDPRAALQDEVRVGEAPVGLALVQHGVALAVADSDRFGAPLATPDVAILSISSGGAMTLRGYLPSHLFPRDMAVSPDGRTLIVSNFGSGQVEAVDVAAAP